MNWLERFQNLLPSTKWPAVVRKPLRFFIVGTLGTFVQTFFFLMLMGVMHQPEHETVLYYIAFIGGFILEMIPNYFCMSLYTFGSMPNKRNVLGFLLARGVNLVIQLVILPLVLWWLDEIPNAVISPIVIFIAGIINFFMQWIFFRDNKTKTNQ